METKEKIEEILNKLMENRLFYVLYRSYEKFSEHMMKVYAGYATLYILMAMIPLLTLIIGIVNQISFFSADAFFSETLAEFMPELPQVREMLTDILQNLNNQSSGWVLGISALTTLWSASSGVSAIQLGLEELDGRKRSQLLGKPEALIFTLLFILMIPSMMIFQLLRQPLIGLVTKILTAFEMYTSLRVFNSFMQYYFILSFAMMVIVVVTSYAYLPSGKHTLKSRMPGAVMTCVASAIFTMAFSFFMGTFWKASAIYGSLAAIFLTTMWLRYVMLILFFGACFNAVLEEEKEADTQI